MLFLFSVVVFDKLLLLLLLLPSSMPGRPKWLWQCVPCTAEKTFQTNIHIPPSKPLCSSKLYFHSLLLAFSLLPCLVARENSTANGGVDVFQAAHNTQQHTAKKGYAQRHQQRHAGETWPKRKGEEWRACSASSTELHPGIHTYTGFFVAWCLLCGVGCVGRVVKQKRKRGGW